MGKRLFKWGILALVSLLTNTATHAQTLVLKHANGNTTDIELLTKPQVKFANDKVLITSTVLDMEFPKEDVLSFTYKGIATGVKSLKNGLQYSQEADKIVFHGIKATDKIAVYNMQGIRVPINLLRSRDSVTLPLVSLSSGVYLLNINGKTTKFIKQ